MVSELAQGWIPQPNGRGSIDILQSCALTIFLCAWSVLFLNIPNQKEGRLDFFKNKSRWMAFVLFFPEVLAGNAAEQWRSACQSVEAFAQLQNEWELALQSANTPQDSSQIRSNLSRIKSCPWTMRHAFYADMGGLLLDCPDFTPFPVDGQQTVYLVKNNHLKYPDVKEKTIWDKNKADGFARFLTLVQITWFAIQAFGRCAQHLALSTFELSTLAFVFCTLNSFFFLRHKPLDVDTRITLRSTAKLEEILVKAGDRVCERYSETPLDFVRPPTSRSSLLAPFWFGVGAVFHWRIKKGALPIKTFGNSKTTPPGGSTIADIIYIQTFALAYLGIHLAGWNFSFPTPIERILWRISSLVLLGSLIFYLNAVAFGTVASGWLARTFFNNHEATTILQVASLLPRWAAVLLHLPMFIIYGLARTYIIVEGFASMRALPKTAYGSINWSNFVPHL
ncbi:hypothetical protein N7G274_002646 [Stereocaulon virgatum]|uniref:Uncharacterized protein n=1 Tax=Stereocaulon virgatum TaxID=373712 RepID=A0ABR4AJ34_9LECA